VGRGHRRRAGSSARGLPLSERARATLRTADLEAPAELGPTATLVAGALAAEGGDPSGAGLLKQGWAEFSAIAGASLHPELGAWFDAHPEIDPRAGPESGGRPEEPSPASPEAPGGVPEPTQAEPAGSDAGG
jgi:hypothetical protein